MKGLQKLIIMSEVVPEALSDNNLDNDDLTIEKNEKKINNILSPLNVKVENVIRYVDSALFVLSVNSMTHQDSVRALFRNHYRYTFEYADINTTETLTNDDGSYLGRMPGNRKSMAIRRIAFKKLPRAIFCSFLGHTVLFSLLSGILYLMYCVYLM